MTGTTASSLPSFGVSWLAEFDRQEMLTGAAACSEIGLPASYDSIFLDMELQYWPSESRKWTTYHQGRCVMPALLGQGVIEECAASFPNGPEEPQIGRPKRAVFSVGYIQDGDKTVTGTRTMAVIEG